MKKTMALALVAMCAFCAAAAEMASQKWVEMKLKELRDDIEINYTASGGVSQAWVEQIVSNAIANSSAQIASDVVQSYTNGVMTYSVGNGDKRTSIAIEDSSVYTLMATNALPAAWEYGISNGTFFVWDGFGGYVAGNGQMVATTNTCFLWNDNASIRTNGVDTFTNYFGVVGKMIQPSMAYSITNGLVTTSANSSLRIIPTLLGSLIVNSAFAAEALPVKPGNWPDSWLPTGYQPVDPIAMVGTLDDQGHLITEPVSLSKLPEWISQYSSDDPWMYTALNAMMTALQTRQDLDDIAMKLENLIFAPVNYIDPETKAQVTSSSAPSASQDSVTREVYLPLVINRINGVDNRSITTNGQGQAALYAFPNDQTKVGNIPFYSYEGGGVGGHLNWTSPIGYFDGKSITAKANDAYSGMIDAGGISLAGWNNPTSNTNQCNDSLSDMITGKKSNSGHYVLTRYDAGSSANLHYTSIGDLSASLGSAIKFIGTSGEAVVGSGSKTNTVTFTHDDYSDVRVTVAEDGNGNATITFGVYYK